MTNTDLTNAVIITDKDAEYDASAKRLLAQKSILAHILVNTVDEFTGMNPRDVEPLIEGTPYISQVSTEPGFTNSGHDRNSDGNGQRIKGFNTEDGELDEGMIRFDIIFYVNTKDGLSQIIINVEAQKSEPSRYDILNRAIFYVSRMISSQKSRDFENTDYNDIKRVYSIWVCMNMKENTMCHIHLTKDDLVGHHDWKGNLDLLNIVMIGLAKQLPEHSREYELHRLLGTLLSDTLNINDKLDIIGNEYHIPLQTDFRKDVNIMCNLSQGIKEEGLAEGISIGETRGIAIGETRGIAIGETRGEARMNTLISILVSQNRFDDIARITKDEAFRKECFSRYGIS